MPKNPMPKEFPNPKQQGRTRISPRGCLESRAWSFFGHLSLGICAWLTQDWSADSHVREFLASDQVRADKAVRTPVSFALESAPLLGHSSAPAELSFVICH